MSLRKVGHRGEGGSFCDTCPHPPLAPEAYAYAPAPAKVPHLRPEDSFCTATACPISIVSFLLSSSTPLYSCAATGHKPYTDADQCQHMAQLRWLSNCLLPRPVPLGIRVQSLPGLQPVGPLAVPLVMSAQSLHGIHPPCMANSPPLDSCEPHLHCRVRLCP